MVCLIFISAAAACGNQTDLLVKPFKYYHHETNAKSNAS